MLLFRVLGPVEVLDGNRVVEISGQRQRRLLCSLIAAGGMVVSSDRLAEQLWDDDDRPPGAVRAVRTYVARLRKSLGDGGSAIVTNPHGYVLSMDCHRLDVADLERLVELARSSIDDDPETAVGLLSESAALWRGDPYGEFGDLEWLRTEVQRLSELQRGVVEELFDARLLVGFGVDLVGDIERAIGSYPLSERLRRQQMEALWRLGRDADAIRAFHDYRQFLGEETGLEPSTDLKQLENDIITGTLTAPNKQTPRRQQSRPTGTVTFLFTDVEGSTRRWEDDAGGMSAALAEHDGVLRGAIEGHGGYVFSTAGDAFAAAFADPVEAVAAAVEAQRVLALPVRMGVHAGTADERDGDYFGPTLNRAARVMGAAHGGQVLLSAATSELVRGVVDLEDLGEHRLRDLSGVEHLFQVLGEGLASEFARLRTVDTGPGNLSAQATSFVGRDVEVNELAEVVSQHRLVTLTGVGGVGKTRLAVQVAAELTPKFGDGVWLVELAPVGDPGAVPDAVATALGVTAQAGRSVTAGIAEALAGRRLLVVLDNCEHVVDAAADLIEAILAVSPTVSIITTSREGLRVDGEHLWPVPPLDVAEGARSAAVELFTERARAVVPGFSLDDDADAEAVIEICRRLDGIALAIELAAARMVSMTPVEVLARLNDRFRLFSGSRRGLERHQTLRQAVQWSYDLLTGDEQTVLGTCAVFAAGFDATAVTAVCERFDEYTMLDLLDSLVRKSLVTVNRAGGRTRHGLLETIRQFAEDQGATSGSGTAVAAGEIFDIGEVRDRHARYFATQAVEHWEIWEGPRHGDAADWVEVEFENLRAGFRWAIDRHDLPTATAIAAHTTALGFGLQQFEPVGWAEELLPAAAAAELPQLPRLYTAASSCAYTGRPEDAVRYAQAATVLQTDARYQPFDIGWAGFMEANAHLYAGRSDRHLEICTALAAQTGLAHVVGLCELTFGLPAVGRSDEAIEIADDAINSASAHANPYWIAFAYWGYGRAFAETDPARSLDTFRVGLAYTQEHRVPYFEAVIASELAGLEAVHGDLDQALNLFTSSLDSFHQAGNTASLALTFARLAVFFDRTNQPEVAATIYGATTHHPTVDQVVGFTAAVDHLHPNLDAQTLDDCVRTGAAMNLTEAVHYAHHHINTTRQHQP